MAIDKTIGSNINTTDAAVLSIVSLNATSSTKLVDDLSSRIYFAISNPSSQDVWVKFQTTTTDNDKKGIFLFKRSFYEMPVDNIYTGEISAIAENGTPDVYITEY